MCQSTSSCTRTDLGSLTLPSIQVSPSHMHAHTTAEFVHVHVHAMVAQLVERSPRMRSVVGSWVPGQFFLRKLSWVYIFCLAC